MTKSQAAPWLRPTTRVERALQDAQEHARQAGFDLPQSGHLLWALVQERNNISTLVLERLGVSSQDVGAEVVRVEAQMRGPQGEGAPTERWPSPDKTRPPSQRRRRIETAPTELAWAENRAQTLDAGRQEAQNLGDTYVGTEHLLLALIGAEGVGGQVLRRLGVTWDGARAALSDLKSVKAL